MKRRSNKFRQVRGISRRIKAIDFESAQVFERPVRSPHSKALFENIEFDHAPVDVILASSMPDQSVVRRAWLTLAVDRCSQAPVGFYLSFDPYRASSVTKGAGKSKRKSSR